MHTSCTPTPRACVCVCRSNKPSVPKLNLTPLLKEQEEQAQGVREAYAEASAEAGAPSGREGGRGGHV